MFARCDEELFEVNGVHIEVNPVLIEKKDGLLTLGFGKGLVELCNQVKEKGSLNKAALEMGMSYSKAWHIIRNAEEILGVNLLQRNGAKGSTVTKEAQELISSYNIMQEQLSGEAAVMALKMIDRIHECSRQSQSS